jgi:hypothetical protein
MHCHWQNLNNKGSILREGRAWLYPVGFEGKRQRCVNISWHFWTHFWALQFEVGAGDGNDGLALWIAFGLLSFHLSIEGILPIRFVEWGRKKALRTEYLGYEYMAWPRTTGVNIHHSTIWFEIWNWQHGWDRNQPKWMSFNFCPIDFLLGDRQYSSQEIGVYRQSVLMPEATYPVTIKLCADRWKRPRWPWPLIVKRAHIDCEIGIPKPGKGENSWDCGEDATYGLTCPAASVEEAIEKLKSSVERDRERYGGKDWIPEGARNATT